MISKTSFLLAALLLVLVATASLLGQTGSAVQGPLRTITSSDPAGTIKMYLPADIRAGDTITGTVYAEPQGTSESERATNAGVLTGYVIDLGGGTKVPVKDGRFRWVASSTSSVISILGNGGNKIASIPVSVGPAAAAAPARFALPKLVQQLRPISISGPFDGDLSNTRLSIGGKLVDVLAESPRQTIGMCPAGPAGPVDMRIADAGAPELTGTAARVTVDLSSPKTALTRGEKTVVQVKVAGLAGINETVPMHLNTTGAANMSGGNSQTVDISPDQLTANGEFLRDFDLTGTRAGNFSVTATVNEPVAGGSAKCKCKCELAKPPITESSKRAAQDGGTEYSYAPNFKVADCVGDKCTIQSKSVTWSITGGTAKHKIHQGTDKAEKLVVDVTSDGTLVITVTVKITCSDGSTCSDTGTKTVTVKK